MAAADEAARSATSRQLDCHRVLRVAAEGKCAVICLQHGQVCSDTHCVTECAPDLLPQALGLSEVLCLSRKGLGLWHGSCRQVQACSVHSKWMLQQALPNGTSEAEDSGCGVAAAAGVILQVRSLQQCKQHL